MTKQPVQPKSLKTGESGIRALEAGQLIGPRQESAEITKTLFQPPLLCTWTAAPFRSRKALSAFSGEFEMGSLGCNRSVSIESKEESLAFRNTGLSGCLHAKCQGFRALPITAPSATSWLLDLKHVQQKGGKVLLQGIWLAPESQYQGLLCHGSARWAHNRVKVGLEQPSALLPKCEKEVRPLGS